MMDRIACKLPKAKKQIQNFRDQLQPERFRSQVNTSTNPVRVNSLAKYFPDIFLSSLTIIIVQAQRLCDAGKESLFCVTLDGITGLPHHA
jgi:hypothetical protein